MTPPGQNYPIHEHSFLFWGLYLGAIVTFTVVLLGIFLLMVHRNSQASRKAAPAAVTPATEVAAAPEAPQVHAA